MGERHSLCHISLRELQIHDPGSRHHVLDIPHSPISRMTEVVSIIAIASTALGLTKDCVGIVRLIKETIETSKLAKNALIELLNRTERTRGLLELVRALTDQIKDTDQRGVLLSFNDSACRKTLTELRALVGEVSHKSSEFWVGIWWISHKKDADVLVEKMREQESAINTLLLSIIA